MKQLNIYIVEKLIINKDIDIDENTYNIGDILYCKNQKGQPYFFRIEEMVNSSKFILAHLYSKSNKPVLKDEYWWTDTFTLNKNGKFEFNGLELKPYIENDK